MNEPTFSCLTQHLTWNTISISISIYTNFINKEMAAYSTHHTVMSSNYENGIESTDFYISKHFGHLTEILKKSNVMYTQYYQ
jgi:hypothetical protein